MGRLERQSILVVEDEVLIAMELETVLMEAGCRTVRLASNVPQALRAVADFAPDVAVLDVNVGGEQVFPVADALRNAEVPYLLVTGHSPAGMPERQRDNRVMLKPYDPRDLVEALADLVVKKA